LGALRGPDFDGVVPGAAHEGVFADEVPVEAVDFTPVLVEILNWKILEEGRKNGIEKRKK